MRVAQVTLLFLSFILIILFHPLNIDAQITPTPTVSSNQTKFARAGNPILDFINKLLGRKVPEKTKEVVESSLPSNTVKANDTAATENFRIQRTDDSDTDNSAQDNSQDVLYTTAGQYHVSTSLSGNQEKKSSSSIFDQLKKLFGADEVKKKGNEKAREFVSEELPAGKSGNLASGLFKEKDEEMAQSIDIRRCMEVPGTVCGGQLAYKDEPENPSSPIENTPTPYPASGPGDNIFDGNRMAGDGTCDLGVGECDVNKLAKYFDGNVRKAVRASQICNAESGGNPFNVNKGCLTHTSYDYSVGLFQINLLAHCPAEFTYKDPQSISCILNPAIVDPSTDETVCEKKYKEIDENINKAKALSTNGVNWNPWLNAKNKCGIENGDVPDYPKQETNTARYRFMQCASEYVNYPPEPPYGVCTICAAGCGPTALANILYNLYDKKYNPKRVLEDFYGGFVSGRNEYGICIGTGIIKASNTLKKLGFEVEYIYMFDSPRPYSAVINDLKKYLAQGWQIFAGSNIYSEKSKTWIGHFYWITNIDGNNCPWVVDSAYGTDRAQPMNQCYLREPGYKYAFAFRKLE